MESDTSDSTCSGLAAASDCVTGETAAAAKSHADDSAVHAAAAGDQPPAIPAAAAAETAGGTPAATAAVSGAPKDPEGVDDKPGDTDATIMLLNWNSKSATISAANWKAYVAGLIAKLNPSLCCLQEIGWVQDKVIPQLQKGLAEEQKSALSKYKCYKRKSGDDKGVCILYRKDHFDDKIVPLSTEFHEILKTVCPEEAYQNLEGRILVWKLTAKDGGSFLVASVHGRHIRLTKEMKRTEQNFCRQALRTLCHNSSLQLVIGGRLEYRA